MHEPAAASEVRMNRLRVNIICPGVVTCGANTVSDLMRGGEQPLLCLMMPLPPRLFHGL